MIYPQDSLGTAFHRLVGDMDTMPLLGENFNKFSPVLILFFSAASLLNAGEGEKEEKKERKNNQSFLKAIGF